MGQKPSVRILLSTTVVLDSLYNLLTVNFLIRLVGGSDNGQLELVLVSSNWLTLFELLRLLILSIIVMRKTKVLFGVVVMLILPLVLVVMILPLVL